MQLSLEVLSFERLFAVPAQHRLELHSSRSRGGLLRGVYWEHEEYDEDGRLIARYRSFDETASNGQRGSGWEKYAPSGELITEGGPWHMD
jgi:hypothetical protein